MSKHQNQAEQFIEFEAVPGPAESTPYGLAEPTVPVCGICKSYDVEILDLESFGGTREYHEICRNCGAAYSCHDMSAVE